MMVISSVYSIVDGLFVFNFAGSDGFAAVNLMMPIAMMISCVGFMAGAGGSALVSKTMGEQQSEKARDQFSLIVYLIIAFSLVVGVAVFLFVPQIAKTMGAEGAIYDNCVIYGRILIAALPAFMLQILFQNFLVVAEKPQMGMVIAISSVSPTSCWMPYLWQFSSGALPEPPRPLCSVRSSVVWFLFSTLQ